MMRKVTAVAASIGVFLAAPLVHAQGREDFGRQGQFILSADRLVPLLSFTRTSQDQLPAPFGNPPPLTNKVTSTYSQTSISLLWGGTSNGSLGSAIDTFYTVPRLGFDYVIVPNVTIGGNIIVFFTLGGSTGSETTFNNGTTMTTSNDNPSALIFGVAPRGGYILELSNLFSLWLRGGVSYYVANSKTTQGTGNGQTTLSNSVNQFAIDLDPQLVITPVPHFGITAGLTADIPIAGGRSAQLDRNGGSTSASAFSSILYIGVTAGLMGWF
jgi:hypothetical protein